MGRSFFANDYRTYFMPYLYFQLCSSPILRHFYEARQAAFSWTTTALSIHDSLLHRGLPAPASAYSRLLITSPFSFNSLIMTLRSSCRPASTFIVVTVFFIMFNEAMMPFYGYYMPWYFCAGVFMIIGGSLMYTVHSSTPTSSIYE